jgi:hypothetical protein
MINTIRFFTIILALLTVNGCNKYKSVKPELGKSKKEIILRGVAILAKACFGHPSPSKRQKLNATANAFGAPDVLRGFALDSFYKLKLTRLTLPAMENEREGW